MRVSDVVASMFGLPSCPAEMARDDLRRRVHPDDLATLDRAMSRSIGSDEAYRADFRVVWPDGQTRWITAKGRVSRAPDGKPLGLMGIAIDVSDRKELEQQLQQSQKLEGIGRLAGGIAHDFNNLLTAIIGYTEMVLDQIGPDKPISGDMREIRNASDRAVALTRQLLAFSRKQTLHVAPVDLNDIVVSMHKMLQRLIGDDIEIRLGLSPRLSPVRADRVQLEQVLMNLVMNARDAMPGGGVITIDTVAVDGAEAVAVVHEPVSPGTYARLRVNDTGVGMDAATQEHIFEPFFTTKGVGKGTGLGLATVYGVIQQLGGHIAVSSEKGKGTTFTLYFPEAPAASVIPSQPRPKSAPLAAHREIVLVVDDQQGVRQLVSRILTRHGYTVLEAGDVTEALALAEQHPGPIDLIVSDVVMPTMSGPELVARLRTIRPVKVLYMSGYTGEDLSNRADFDETTIVLEKPFTASVLLQTVRGVLDDRALDTESLNADPALR
jgi:two-component system cell cycle sensor histidine kinase/response regulator CckA